MRILITGAGGFIGHHLVIDQLRKQRQVVAVDLQVESLQAYSQNEALTLIQSDFRRREAVDPFLNDIDICFHLASAHLETNVDDAYFWEVNVDGTLDFVQKCRERGVGRFVHCSSVGVYGDIDDPPADEMSACNPDIAYEKSKLAAEEKILAYAAEHDYDLTVIRPAWVYGPRCPRTAKLFRTIEKGRFFFVGEGKGLRHPLYIDDMIAGFEIAGTHPDAPGEIFIMAGPRAITVHELVQKIAESLQRKPPTLHLPQVLVYPACLGLELLFGVAGREAPFTRRSLKFFTGNTAFSTEKARRVLGYEAVTPLSEGLAHTKAWLFQERHGD